MNLIMTFERVIMHFDHVHAALPSPVLHPLIFLPPTTSPSAFVFFFLMTLCVSLGLHRGNIGEDRHHTVATSLKKMSLLPPSNHHLPVNPQEGKSLFSHDKMLMGLTLSRSFASNHSLSEFNSVSTLSLPLAFQFFLSPPLCD